ncbi:probable LRR receptor-like serine/threonine-protein kinase RFK1 isoform X2 [Impatiens glandulifera]|uniref:probable LRR receptor-like serine/threonine-protein kinase RFK1 isoform X2 n=1 Tax=Impatiens glandulifera TaxID=253017 RepID=UPI001FB1888B|nr:probable LRR receptor-like serine/threonine-protein kinase RFK1 isoform X2 [Impatiens glandulifera]
MLPRKKAVLFLIFALSCCCWLQRFAQSKLPQEQVDTLRTIISAMGSKYWKFDSNSCQVEMVGTTRQEPLGSESIVECKCNLENSSYCHIVRIVLKGHNLPGILPPEMANLPYLQEVDFAYNYLGGTFPPEWASMKLKSISVLANRLSGKIPKHLGNISTLTYLNLEANQFSGSVPTEFGSLHSLKNLLLSSNRLSGELPTSFAKLINLTDFRINDNNFSGKIPNFILNWKQLMRLEIMGSGLEGPIPIDISQLTMLTDLRIANVQGKAQAFPDLSNTTGLNSLVLRNCNLSEEIPQYIWKFNELYTLDVSFNKLVGKIPSVLRAKYLKLVFLTGNMLSGEISGSMLKDGMSMNLNINLYRSSSMENALQSTLPCTKNFKCPKYECSFHVNCGGDDLVVKENSRKVSYEGDAVVEGGTAKYFTSSRSYWGLSSTGDFMDDNDVQNTRYVKAVKSTNLSELYSTARLSPIALTYFGYCLENGGYTVSLHFAEIFFTNDNTSSSLGKRMFDIYIQDTQVKKNFNIEDEAGGALKPLIIHFNATVKDNTLQIRFSWAGKGTTRIPNRGVYGPLISAISVVPNFKTCSDRKKGVHIYIIIGSVTIFFILFLLSILFWKYYLKGGKRCRNGMEGIHAQISTFTLKQIRAATNNFELENKIGEGGFGPVYKGQLPDGTAVAVKQLSSVSRQGNREFLNEIGLISCLQHPNLVKLHGCCIEGDQLLLVYEFMENNSLARVLFGDGAVLDWPMRLNICIGIAKGLAFLHDESRLKIVHRDIKATNILLDRNLNPKISDFGLARLEEEDKTHVSTQVAGTRGYMAPEYALWGHLSYKADVYSYGVVLLEIVHGKSNNSFMASDNTFLCLIEWAIHVIQNGNIVDLIDEKLGSEVNKEEVERVIKVAILCTNGSPSSRPTMSEVTSMLEGQMDIPDINQEQHSYTDDLRFSAIRDIRRFSESQNMNSKTIMRSEVSDSCENITEIAEDISIRSH